MSNRTYYSREAEEQARRDQLGNTALFIVLGLVIGAVLAILLTPSSGEDIREELGSTINDRLHEGRDTTNSAIRRLEKEFSDLRRRVEDRIS